MKLIRRRDFYGLDQWILTGRACEVRLHYWPEAKPVGNRHRESRAFISAVLRGCLREIRDTPAGPRVYRRPAGSVYVLRRGCWHAVAADAGTTTLVFRGPVPW